MAVVTLGIWRWVKGFNRGKKDVKKLYYSKTHNRYGGPEGSHMQIKNVAAN